MQASDDGVIRVTGTNLEVSTSAVGGANVQEAGAITVPAKTLLDLLATLPDDAELAIKTKETTLNISSKKPKLTANIKGIDAQEFPNVPEAATLSGLVFDAKQFKKLIERSAFAAAKDEARPILMALNIRVKDKHVSLNAADGFRLSREVLEQDVADMEMSIPARALLDFYKMIDPEEPITIGTANSGALAVMTSGLITVVAQLIEGLYPDLSAVIPNKSNTFVTISRTDLYKAFKASDVFAREAGDTTRLKIVPEAGAKPGMVQVVAVSAETGDNITEVDAIVQGPGLEIAFNTKYLVDVLNALDGDKVQIGFTQSNAPAVVTPIPDEGSYKHVIMPMHLSR